MVNVAYSTTFELTAEKINEELETVNFGSWKVFDREHPTVGKFTIMYTMAGIIGSISPDQFNESVRFIQSKEPMF